MATKTKIFFTGATGYIGGSVLERLLAHPNAKNFQVTALIRSPEKAEKFKQYGINTVVGSLHDAKLVEDLTADADIVIDTVDADAYEPAKTMLRGFKRSYEKTGKPAIFIHTSGTGLFADDAAGMRITDMIWDDANPDQLETLAPTAPHRNVDLELIRADEEGYVKSYLITPSTIYGLASGKFVDAGLQNRHSIQVPALVNASLDRGRAGMVGKGENLWPNVHVDDVADLYIVLLDNILSKPNDTGHGREGYYFGENGEHSLYDVSKALGLAMVELGKCADPEPTTFTKEDIDKYFNGSNYLGSNSRARANRSRAIGWKPTRTTKDFLESIKPEVEQIIKSGYKVPLR